MKKLRFAGRGGFLKRANNAMKKKILVIVLAFVVGFSWVLINLTKWQIFKGSELAQAAIEQQTRDKTINSKRGSILDRNGNVLAASVSVETLTASPVDVHKNEDTSIEEISHRLADMLDLEYEDVYNKLKKKTSYAIIKKKMDKELADKVRNYLHENKIKGFTLVTDTKRYYPYDNLASHILGFTGTDNQGLAGIELE